jgi:DNA processing protein
MSIFGINDNEAASMVRNVTAGNVDDEEVRDRTARAAWSAISEPGDRVAGLVVASLGAARALDLLVERRTAREVLGLMQRGDSGAPGDTDVLGTDVQKALDRWAPRLSPASIMATLRQAERVGARLLVPGSAGWPGGMADLGEYGPLALWCRGTDAALAALETSIALVGARAATSYGEKVAMDASAGLVDRGYAIVSGAAYGIDGMAHRSALANHGQTVAFLAGGVDRFYPAGHDELLSRIAEHGAVLSELACGQAPTKWRFLQRNRLIAAASQATVVLEAGWRSGSLNTASHAATLGRPLGAVPGPVTSTASEGCHRLIREFDAVCVTNAAEMAELAPLHSEMTAFETVMAGIGGGPRLGDRPPTELRVIDAMSTRSPRGSTDIAARSGLSVQAVRGALGSLALEGYVTERESGWVVK